MILSSGGSALLVPSLRGSVVWGGSHILWGVYLLSDSFVALVTFCALVTRPADIKLQMRSSSTVTISSVVETIQNSPDVFKSTLECSLCARTADGMSSLEAGNRPTRTGAIGTLGWHKPNCRSSAGKALELFALFCRYVLAVRREKM